MTRFALLYRVSNTNGWRVFDTYASLEEARAARKANIGWRAPAEGRAVSGKILGWNIEPREIA